MTEIEIVFGRVFPLDFRLERYQFTEALVRVAATKGEKEKDPAAAEPSAAFLHRSAQVATMSKHTVNTMQ